MKDVLVDVCLVAVVCGLAILAAYFMGGEPPAWFTDLFDFD